MRILFTVLMSLLCCSTVFGQEFRTKEDLSKTIKMRGYKASAPSSYKTALDNDTVRIIDHVLGPDTLCFPDSIFILFPGTLGYANGTMKSFQLQDQSWVRVTEHGVNLSIPKKLEYPNAQVIQLLVRFADGTKVMGDADTFSVNVWKSSPVQSTLNVPPTYSVKVNPEQYPSFPAEESFFTPIYFEDNPQNVNQISTNMLFTIQTAKNGSDDTLTLAFNTPSCDPDNLNSWYCRVMKSDAQSTIKPTQFGWATWNQIFGPLVNVPLMVPVVVYSSTEVGIDEAVSVDGLSMLSAYPNPSADQTKIRFNLARNGSVKLQILDLMGRSVLPQVKFDAAKGMHEYTLDTRELACGQYICVIQTNQGALATRISVEK